MAKEKVSDIPKPKPLRDTFLASFKTFKNNKEFFLLTPAIIGGGIQLFYLLSIDFNFVRFFSASQLLADGLVFFIFFAFLFISYKLLFHLSSFLLYKFWKKNNKIFYHSIVYLIYLTLFLLDIFEFIPKESIFHDLLFIFGWLILIVSTTLFIRYKLDYPSRFLNFYQYFLIIFFGVFLTTNSLYFVQKLNSPYFLNYINIMTIVKDVFPENRDFEILYYNDKYIFVKITIKDGEKENEDIHIFKQDAFFNDYSQSKTLNDLLKKGKILEKKDSIYNSKIDSLNLVIEKLKNK